MAQLQTYVVTGGNSGIGYETVLELARRGHAVVIGARDKGRLESSVSSIREATGNANVFGYTLELSSLKDVYRFATDVKAQHPRLAGIICNAGIGGSEFQWSTDGFELVWATNHLGHFYLIKLLLPLLVAPARVVLTSSGTHDPKVRAPLPAPKWDTPTDISMPKAQLQDTPPSRYNPMQAYTNSKLCNIYVAYHLATLGHQGITTAAYDPGYIPGTSFMRTRPRWQVALMERMIPIVMRLRGSPQRPSTTPKSGSYQARLACDPQLHGGQTGVYYEIDHLAPSSELSYDTAKSAALWSYSEEVLVAAGVPLQL